MDNNISYTNTDLGIKYNKLVQPQISTGVPFSIEPYQVENGELKKYPLPLINATDINWGGVNINNSEINTTDDLLHLISTKGTGNSDIDIDSNTILGIMLKTISALQVEVTKLRNSFRFGINSYTDENFGMSQSVNELSNTQEEEPLWATDESELKFVEGLDLSQQSYKYITPVENFHILPNDKLLYSNTISFIIPEDINGKNILETLTDAKQYVYITCTSKDIDIKLRTLEGNEISFNVKNIVRNNYIPEKYNILLIVSKKIEDNNKLVGDNFIWISISEWGTGTDLYNGYITETIDFDYDTSETVVYNEHIFNVSEIQFNTITENYIYKLDVYSKYQDVLKTIDGSTPASYIEAATPTNVEDYKYRTASITIRSMKTEEKIKSHTNELQNNELIFCEASHKLYIYTNGKLINIGSGNSDTTNDDIMENYEILKALEAQGLISIIFKNDTIEPDSDKYAESNIKSWILNSKVSIKETLNDIEKIKFINGETGKKFDVSMNPYGEFDIKEEQTKSMLDYVTKSNGTSWLDELPDDYKTDRSFVSILKGKKKSKDITKDLRLDADRIQIGAIYAPLNTDTIHGCTHGYIELTNTSNEDFYLDGCYLHYSYVDNPSTTTVVSDITYYELPLDGYIPAGGTYLIRCKQYSTIDDPNTFINVCSYDKEWYIDGELLDLSISKNCSLGLALTYGDIVNGSKINPETILAKPLSSVTTDDTYTLSNKGSYVLAKGMIDACYIGKDWGATSGHWVSAGAQGLFTIYSNTIYKVTFELDPAKQAFNSFTTSDSSRVRWQNSGTDYQYVNLDREYIEFPKTNIKKAVADYTPKASFEHKNVISDKTKLDKTKPNAIVCSFGINPYTTRCFNWVSSGLFDEAVVIIDPDTNQEYIFESYKNIASPITQKSTFPRRKEFSVEINNIVYGSGQIIYNLDKENEEREYGLEVDSDGNPLRKRLYNTFPGNNEPYTSHKCIIDVVENPLNAKKTYQYYICRLDKFGKIDNTYKSELRSFTLYPESYNPRIYQITDQQGFHWIEYQVWAASAKKLNDLIQSHINNENIMPIIINTGDAVQSGARVNEWLDYFIAGDYLFNHLEQMNIVGNNDLCDINVNALGTGDDTGKSNSYFFHLFNCYEIPTDEYKPIANNVYIPSLYYMDIKTNNNKTRLLFINSEITTTCCNKWFKLRNEDKVVNIYTGFTIATPQVYSAITLNFKPIYDILWQWTNEQNTAFLPICHEMPFTVVTNNCLGWDLNEYTKFRSLSDTGALIGSHTNQIDASENGKGMHWMSRLFEYRNITLCLGGHKHTYACTYPARENYLYKVNDVTKWSYKDGSMDMPSTLENDTAEWTIEITINNENKVINLSKFPIVKRQDEHKLLDTNVGTEYTYSYEGESIPIKISQAGSKAIRRFYPFVDAKNNDANTFVIYLMCQATGYKLTSNKELPSEFQKFSMIIPKSYIDKVDTKGKTTDKPSSDQQMPMFSIINVKGNNDYQTQLGRINNISNSKKKLEFTQLAHNTGANNQLIEYLIMTKKSINGLWAYYTGTAFKQTYTYDGSKVNADDPYNFVYINGSTTDFNVEDNGANILYTNLVTPTNIYLFNVNSNGMYS